MFGTAQKIHRAIARPLHHPGNQCLSPALSCALGDRDLALPTHNHRNYFRCYHCLPGMETPARWRYGKMVATERSG